MVNLTTLYQKFNGSVPILKILIAAILAYTIFHIIMVFVKKALLKRARTKRQFSNLEILFKLLHYVFLILLFFIGVFSYAGSWTGLGIGVGVLSAALGWAFQRPITGVGAWIMVVVKRPFEIGDRVVIGAIKGDVIDIDLSNITLKEVIGDLGNEDKSGKIIYLPNSRLFEETIVNYTAKYDYTLYDVVIPVTYKTDLDKAIKLILNVAKKQTKAFSKQVKKEPYVNLGFTYNGIEIALRYFAPPKDDRTKEIIQDVHVNFRKAKGIWLAYNPFMKNIEEAKK